MHDLDSMSGSFSFNTCPLSSINFVLLKPEGAPSYNAADLLHLYKSDAECKSLKPYMPLIKDSPLYPIVLDANLTNANIILDTMVTIFSQYCASPTHSVILHSINIAEDIDIAYGYNNTVKHVPQTCTVRGEQPLNLLMYLLRDEIGWAGHTEVLTHGLCSIHDNFTTLGSTINQEQVVSLSNPANVEYEVVHTTLSPGLLKTLQHNCSENFTTGIALCSCGAGECNVKIGEVKIMILKS